MAGRFAGDTLSDPGIVAKTVLRAATARRPRTRYATGYQAKSIFMRGIRSDRAFDRLITDRTG